MKSKKHRALWNLLLGILDKATLTLGDNRKVDFSAAMVFVTSNLGAAEMSSLVSPRLGFHAPSVDDTFSSRKLSARISSAGVAAARRKFTPEFINRLDNIVVFKSLGREELRRIVDIELEMVQQRIQTAAANKAFRVNVADTAREFLLVEGTDSRYGAALEARDRTPARTTIVEPDGQRPDSVWRFNPREPRRGVRWSDIWP
jgi:ATP-dependent Clp protease ATP-binding subunit ClpB